MASSTSKGDLSDQLVEMLRCPRTKQPLERADRELVDRANRAIAAGALQHVGGTPVDTAIDGALVTRDGKFLYAVLDRIPVLLPDEAIAVDDLER